MTFGTSSKWIVFKGALKRFKWLSILFGVALFLETPLPIWMEINRRIDSYGGDLTQFANNSHLPQIIFNPIQHFTNIAVSIIFGLILFYYLQNDKASTFFHSLPIKRWSLYLQNLLAGLTLVWLPLIVNGLIIYGVYTYFGITEMPWPNQQMFDPAMELLKTDIPKVLPVWQVVIDWLLLSLLMTGLFLIFTVFVGMFTGNVLLQGALTLIGLVLPLGIYVLIKYNLGKLLYGFSSSVNNRNIEWLSPIVSYLDESHNRLIFKESTWYLWYFAVALIFCILGIYLYKKRAAEAAGETLAAEWIRRLFKYGVTTCSALTGGAYFSTFNENSIGYLYLGYLIGGALGYIVADMVAYKSFHFYRRWKGLLIFGLTFVLAMVSINLDLYGFEKYVPEQDEVKEVFLSNLNPYGYPATEGITGKDNITRIRQLHQQIIKMKEQNKFDEVASRTRQFNYIDESLGNKNNIRPEEVKNLIGITINYVLESGTKVSRTYTIDTYRYKEFLRPVFNSQEVKMIIHNRLFKMDLSKIDQINVTNHHLAKNIRLYKRAEINEAVAALRKDVLNTSFEALVEGKALSRANIEFFSTVEGDQQFITYNLNYNSDFKNFETFLEKSGYLKDLVLNPDAVSKIQVNRVGDNKTVEVKDKENIKVLLDMVNMEDERTFILRQKEPAYKDNIIYFGKIEKKNGEPIYAMFENSPYALQLMKQILKDEQ